MQKNEVLDKLIAIGIVPVVRITKGSQVMEAAEALMAGGISIMEVTMSSTRPFEIIQNLKKTYGDQILVGLGSVLNPRVAQKGIDAGAEFIVSPIFDEGVLEIAHSHDKPAILGALTPTEIQRSFAAGTDIVKVFPATTFGPGYFKDILAPMPHLKMTPTGGVNLTNVADFIRNGAVCVGVGTALLQYDLINNARWDDLADLARQYYREVEKGRA